MTEIPKSLIDSGLLNDLPTPPAVAMEILRLADDPESGLSDLAAVLERDPALSARIVSISNSATYARSREVTSVAEAASVLGSKTLSLIALSFSLASGLAKSGSIAGLDLNDFWRRSLTVGAVARHVGRAKARSIADEAFLAGLLAHLGRLVLAQKMTAQYTQLVRSADGWPSHAQEIDEFGFSSADLSVAAVEEWGLPPQISTAIHHAFDPEARDSSDELTLGELIELAILADASLNGSDPESHEKFGTCFEQHFGEESEVFDGVVEAIQEAAATLDINASDDLTDDDLLARARNKMFEATMALADTNRRQEEQVSDLERERNDLAERATRDALTGLGNRHSLDDAIYAELGRRRRDGLTYPMGVVMMDIDHFKSLNDTYGHGFGDEVLAETAQALSSVVRRNEMVYRYGGEEFLLFMPTVEADALGPIGERLRKVVEAQEFDHNGEKVYVTISVGVAATKNVSDEDSVADLITAADELLYEAKRGGRNCVKTTFVE